MKDKVLADIRQIAADVFNLPLDAIAADSSPDSIEGWDSLKHINLMMAIEQAFSIEIMPEEMAEIRTVGDAVQVVGRKLS